MRRAAARRSPRRRSGSGRSSAGASQCSGWRCITCGATGVVPRPMYAERLCGSGSHISTRGAARRRPAASAHVAARRLGVLDAGVEAGASLQGRAGSRFATPPSVARRAARRQPRRAAACSSGSSARRRTAAFAPRRLSAAKMRPADCRRVSAGAIYRRRQPEVASAEAPRRAAVAAARSYDATTSQRSFPPTKRRLAVGGTLRRVGRRRLVEKLLEQRDEAQPVGAEKSCARKAAPLASSASAAAAVQRDAAVVRATRRCQAWRPAAAHASSASKPACTRRREERRQCGRARSRAARRPLAAAGSPRGGWRTRSCRAQNCRSANVAREHGMRHQHRRRVGQPHERCAARRVEQRLGVSFFGSRQQRGPPAGVRSASEEDGQVPAKRRRPNDASGKWSTTELMALS